MVPYTAIKNGLDCLAIVTPAHYEANNTVLDRPAMTILVPYIATSFARTLYLMRQSAMC